MDSNSGMNLSVHGAKTQLSKPLDLIENGDPVVPMRHKDPCDRLLTAQSAPHAIEVRHSLSLSSSSWWLRGSPVTVKGVTLLLKCAFTIR